MNVGMMFLYKLLSAERLIDYSKIRSDINNNIIQTY